MMLDYMGLEKDATNIRNAIFSVLEEGKVRTRDCGGTSSTTEFTDAIISKL